MPAIFPTWLDRKPVVVDGASISCDKGSIPETRLNGTCVPTMRGESAPFVTINDHNAENVTPFGFCEVLCAACKPVTPKPWSPGGNIDAAASGVFVLVSSSRLKCVHKGIIRIVDPGQQRISTTEVNGSDPGGDALYWAAETAVGLLETALGGVDNAQAPTAPGDVVDSPSQIKQIIDQVELVSPTKLYKGGKAIGRWARGDKRAKPKDTRTQTEKAKDYGEKKAKSTRDEKIQQSVLEDGDDECEPS